MKNDWLKKEMTWRRGLGGRTLDFQVSKKDRGRNINTAVRITSEKLCLDSIETERVH